MSSLENEIIQLENYLNYIEKTNLKISKSNVGWHIEHCLLVITGIINQLEISKPTDFKPKWSFPRFFVFTTGKIPRGKAKAPKVVSPTIVPTVFQLIEKIKLAKDSVTKLNSLSENVFFKHQIFGDLNKKNTEKFLAIHTKHHLKIMKDILKNNKTVI